MQKSGDPTRSGNAMGDILGGMNLVIGVLMAVNARYTDRSWSEKVDVSLVGFCSGQPGERLYSLFRVAGSLPVRNGNAYASIAPV